MNPVTALFSTASKGRAGHVRLVLERLEGRDLPSGATLVPNAGADLVPQIARAEYTQDNDGLTRTGVSINVGDGTYTVRFFEYDSANRTISPNDVAVNIDLPVDSKGEFVSANYRFGGQPTSIAHADNVLWIALAEKAYAQLDEKGWSRADWTTEDDGIRTPQSLWETTASPAVK